MKNNFILMVFIFSGMIGYSQSEVYKRINTCTGSESLTLNPDNTYEYIWYRFYDVGPIEDTIIHEGQWGIDGDTLILNSNERPNNYDFIEFTEGFEDCDSITVTISSMDSNSFFNFFIPAQIRINDRYYRIEDRFTDPVKFSIAYDSRVDHLVLVGYPIYFPKKNNSNTFHMRIKELDGSKYCFPENTYFLNKKYLLRDSLLFDIWNTELKKNIVYKRSVTR